MARFLFVFLAVGVTLAFAQTNYNAGDSARQESVNSDGSVQGQYSYTDATGKQIIVKYRASKERGFEVEGDHLPKAPEHPQNAVAPQNKPYDPFYNPNLHHSATPPTPVAPTHPPSSYNPFVNPHVPAHLYQQAPTHPPPAPVAPTHPPSSYNPFVNPHVPAHLYQQAPTHPPNHYSPSTPNHQPHSNSAVPTLATSKGSGYNPFYNEDTLRFNPFVNPNVPSELYAQHNNGQQHNNYQHHQQPANNAPVHSSSGGSFPAGTFGGGRFGNFNF